MANDVKYDAVSPFVYFEYSVSYLRALKLILILVLIYELKSGLRSVIKTIAS